MKLLTLDQFVSELNAEHLALHERLKALRGRQIVVTSNYNDQPMGTSKPSMKGKTLTIERAMVDSGRLFVVPVDCRTYMNVDEFELVGDPEVIQPKYPISHGSHIIQFHDDTFVWYDEAGLQGGLGYSLEEAQHHLSAYMHSLG